MTPFIVRGEIDTYQYMGKSTTFDDIRIVMASDMDDASEKYTR